MTYEVRNDAGHHVVADLNPATKVVAAIDELKDQVACTNCGRPFAVTPDRQDLCARCSVEG